MEELRAGWEVPSIAHYCEIFRKPFRLPEFDVDELEEAFIASGSPDGSTLLTQLFIQLLKGCYPHKGIGEPSYIRWLHNLCKCNGYEGELPFSQDTIPEAFYTVPQKDKVDLLYMLCHVRLNSTDVSDLLKGYDGDYLRLEPIGMDGSGAIYWYFDDTRLYKEDPPPKRTAARKKAAGRKTPNKAQSACAKAQAKTKQQSQRQSRSLGNVANTKGSSNSAKSTPERTTRLRTRSVHNLRATRSRVSSDIQSDSSDQSPQRKRVKKEADPAIGTQKTEPDNKNADTSVNPMENSPVDGVTPRRSSRTRSATSWYQYEMGKGKKVEPSDPRSSSDSDSDSGVTLAQVTATGDMSDNGVGRWHLVCVTIDDWTALAQQFHKSSVACERKLCRRLMNDMIPLVESRYEQKEKLRRKKLLEVAPRRTSGRLEVKRHLQEEDSSRWDQHGPSPYGEYGRRRRTEEEIALNLEEIERKQKEEREREREKARIERMRRVELRELRASLIAQGKEIPPELFGTPHQESDSDTDDSTQEELVNAMNRVLSLVRQRRDAWPFRHPVDEEFAPNYRVVIQRPMDLETMEKKLRNGEYIFREQFAADFDLIFDNCRKYNGPVNDYTHLANKLEEFVKRVMAKYLPEEEPESSSSEEDEDSINDSSSDDDSYQQNRDASGVTQFQTLTHVPTQRWTSSLSRSSLSTAAAPSLTQPRRPCYAASYTPRKTTLLQGASTIITIRRIPDSTPPAKFYASHNISSSEQRGLVKKFPGNLAEIAAKHGPGKYQIVAVPADGFITDVTCMAVPKTTEQNTVVTNNQDANRVKLVTVDSGGQSRTSGLLTTAVKVVPTQTVSVSVQPVSLLTSTSTTQTFQATSQGRVVTDGGGSGQVTVTASNPKGVAGNSAGKPRVVDSQGGQRVVVTTLTHPVSVTSESRLSPASRVLTNSCQAPATVQRIPHTLPRPPVVPGQSLKPLADHGQQKSLLNGQVTGSPKTIVVTNGQPYAKSPHVQGTKGSEMTVKPNVVNTSSCVVTPVSSRVSTSVSSSST